MVTFFDGCNKAAQSIASSVDDYEEFVFEWFTRDRLGLELYEVDTGVGKHGEHFGERTWLVAGGNDERSAGVYEPIE